MKDNPVIYGFGSACVDYRIHIPDMGEDYKAKILADDVMELGGGACANCLVQAARLGASCTYLGKLGDDHQRKVILSMFESDKIRTELTESAAGTLSPFNVAVYKGTDNERVGGYLLPNSIGSITCREAEELARRMKAGSSVIAEIGEIPLESVLAFVIAALEHNVTVFIDVDLDPIRQLHADLDLFEAILRNADVIIPNYDAVSGLYNEKNHKLLTELLVRKFNKTTIITAGEKGVFYSEPGSESKHIKADEINVIDSVGAGDSFHGSLMYAIGSGTKLNDAIKFAMKCAQKTCTGFGARTSMPFKSDLT